MPMPPLKPLIQAAMKAYNDIRQPKEASTLHQSITLMGSFMGYGDTSSAKKEALLKLAELDETKDSDVEAQNNSFRLEIDKLLKPHSKDGDHFKAIYEILRDCAYVVTLDKTGSPIRTYMAVEPQLQLLRNQLDSQHDFFKEFKVFLNSLEMYRSEILVAPFQKLLSDEHEKTKKAETLVSDASTKVAEERVRAQYFEDQHTRLEVLYNSTNLVLRAEQQIINDLREEIVALKNPPTPSTAPQSKAKESPTEQNLALLKKQLEECQAELRKEKQATAQLSQSYKNIHDELTLSKNTIRQMTEKLSPSRPDTYEQYRSRTRTQTETKPMSPGSNISNLPFAFNRLVPGHAVKRTPSSPETTTSPKARTPRTPTSSQR